MEDALPFMPDEVQRWQAKGQQACVAPVKEEHCVSRHPLWSCSFSRGRCVCRWSTACRGVGGTLQAADGAHLICRPGGDEAASLGGQMQVYVRPGGEGLRSTSKAGGAERVAKEEGGGGSPGMCQCSGFQACPGKARGWQCTLARGVPASESRGLWQAALNTTGRNASSEESHSKALVVRAGGTMDLCRCRSTGERTVLYLSSAERAALREHPLSEVVSAFRFKSDKNKTGVSGKTITKKVRQHSKDGQEEVVLTISDGGRHRKGRDDEGRASQDEEEGDSKSSRDSGSGGKAAGGGRRHRAKLASEEEDDEGDRDSGGSEDGGGAGSSADGGEEDQRGDELTESCVVTDGRPGFQGRHMVVLGAMLVPLLFVLLVMAQIRWRCASSPPCPCAGRRPVQPSGGTGSPSDASPRTSQNNSAAEAHGEVERRPPVAVTTISALTLVLLKITVTVIISTSHIIVTQGAAAGPPDRGSPRLGRAAPEEDSALGGVSSGLLIAAEPVGGLLGTILAERTRLMWPKETFLAAAGLVCLGCIGFIVGVRLQSFGLMLAFRAFSGLGEGICFVAPVILARLSSPDVRTEVFSILEMGVAAGLILGPVLTSVASHVSGGSAALALEGGVWFVVVAALVLACAMWIFLPSSEELCAAAGISAEDRPAWRMDVDMPEEKWAAVLVVCSSTMVRLFSRLVWESSAVLVLTAHFCLGYSNSGYVVPLVILFHFSSQAAFVRLSSWISDHNLVRLSELMELCGLVLMFRPPRDLEKTVEDDIMRRESALAGILVFLFASGLFYTGNSLTSAPLNSWGTKRGPREVCVLFWQTFSVQTGVAGGAILSRVFAGADPHQNTLVFVLLPAVIAQVLLSEMGLGACSPEPESACIAAVEASGCSTGNKGAPPPTAA